MNRYLSRIALLAGIATAFSLPAAAANCSGYTLRTLAERVRKPGLGQGLLNFYRCALGKGKIRPAAWCGSQSSGAGEVPTRLPRRNCQAARLAPSDSAPSVL